MWIQIEFEDYNKTLEEVLNENKAIDYKIISKKQHCFSVTDCYNSYVIMIKTK